MQWASAISSATNLDSALSEAQHAIIEQLGNTRPDLVCAFVSPGYEDDYRKIPELVHQHLAPGTLIGCTALGIIGAGQEVEHHIDDQPAIALTAAVLPDVDLHAFHLETEDLPTPDAAPKAWVETLQVAQDPPAHFVLLTDPYCNPQPLLMGLDFAYSQGTRVGGMASLQQDNCLFLDDAVFNSGLVGVALQGNLRVDTIVAQGCRPIGTPMTVTSCERNVLLELDQRPAVEVLVELFHSLPPADQDLLRHALHLGIASTEFQENFKQGDFLIRNLMHIDQEKGCIAIQDMLRSGQTVQFHLRDASTATEDLSLMLGQYQMQTSPTSAAGGLLFTCTGRGQYLYDKPNHDSDAFKDVLGDLPLGGFFCGGEIGQVGASTYLHGYTSSFAIFRPREA